MNEILQEESSDESLLMAAREGSEAALAQLYRRHHQNAVLYARRFVRSTADAEDVSADALVRMMAALRAGRGPIGNVGAYLRTTVRRLAIDLTGRNARDVAVGLDCEHAESGGTRTDTALDAVLELAFTGLPPRWREALWMVEVLGYRPQDIAAEQGIARAAACSLLWRARTALRARYDELSTCVPPDY